MAETVAGKGTPIDQARRGEATTVSLLFSPDRPLARSLASGRFEAVPRPLAVASPCSATDDRAAPSGDVSWCRRAAVVRQAVMAALTDQPFDLSTIFCDNHVGRTPTRTIHSRAELERVCRAGDDALQPLEVRIDGIDVFADKAIAEWQVTAIFCRPFLLGDDRLVEATGRAVELPGVTTAAFDGDRIRAFRHYLEDATLFEQLLSLR
jgi:SnoaL-like domain